ncbi:hypothetical protein [Nostoc sp. C117]|uniref:hypothetical protein n=1 Tax=Nostoc sp. C117 TaxID=3349875 RepID=UPI00370D9721
MTCNDSPISRFAKIVAHVEAILSARSPHILHLEISISKPQLRAREVRRSTVVTFKGWFTRSVRITTVGARFEFTYALGRHCLIMKKD